MFADREAREAAEQADAELAARIQASMWEERDSGRPFSPARHVRSRLDRQRERLLSRDGGGREDEGMQALNQHQEALQHRLAAMQDLQQRLEDRDGFLNTLLANRVASRRGELAAVVPRDQPSRRIPEADPMQALFRSLLPLLQIREMDIDQDLSYEQLMELSERLGEVGNGADEESINRHTAEAKYEGATEGVEVPTCTVCMSDFEAGDELRVLPCSHQYHKACVDQWLQMNKTCPMCKHEIDA